MRALLRAHPRHFLACAAFTVGVAVMIFGGVSLISLLGSLVAVAGSVSMARTADQAGA
jgi:hypothetical protein